jgi:hypothetical protein
MKLRAAQKSGYADLVVYLDKGNKLYTWKKTYWVSKARFRKEPTRDSSGMLMANMDV